MQPKIEFVDDLKWNETGDAEKEEEDQEEEKEEEVEDSDNGDDEEWMHGKRPSSKKPPKPKKATSFPQSRDVFELPRLKDVKLSPLQSFEQLGAQIPTYKQVLER